VAFLSDHAHASHTAAAIAQHVRYANLLVDARSRVTCCVKENRVEHTPPQGKSTIAKPAISVLRNEVTAKLPTGRRSDNHSSELRRPLRLDLRENSHVVEHS
jgi:hypothetical protein